MNTYFQDQEVLVTGAAGFIGTHLVEALVEAGAKVTGIDNFITGRRSNIDYLSETLGNTFRFIEADASAHPSTYLPQDYVPEVIFHFASPASPPLYQAHPVETYLVNSMGTHHLLQHLKQVNPKGRFVFASTSEIYGDPQQHPQTESYWGNVNPNGIRSCYDEAKRMGETICGVHFRDLGIDTRLVRIFNTYGPRINPEDGRVIPDFVSQALRGQPPMIQGKGTQTRSFCYVSDLVAGILVLASSENGAGQTVNLGNTEEITVKDLAVVVQRLVGEMYGISQVEPQFEPLPGDDPTRRQPDLTKAKELLGWEPKISFEDGLRQTIQYFKEHELK